MIINKKRKITHGSEAQEDIKEAKLNQEEAIEKIMSRQKIDVRGFQ